MNFRVTEFYLLIQLIESCRPALSNKLAEIAKLKDNQNLEELPDDKKVEMLNQAFEMVVSTLLTSKAGLCGLLASAKDQDITDIEKLSFADFIKDLKKLFVAVNWAEVLGELKGLIPEDKMTMINQLLSQIQDQAKQQTQDS